MSFSETLVGWAEDFALWASLLAGAGSVFMSKGVYDVTRKSSFGRLFKLWFRDRYRPSEGGLQLEKPVGFGWTKLLRLVMPQSAFDRHFLQTRADARDEELKALANGDLDEVRRIRWKFHYNAVKIVVGLVGGLPMSLLTGIFNRNKPDNDE